MVASPAYVEQLSSHSASHWWYEARRELVELFVKSHVQPGSTGLDIGCGTGEQLQLLASYGATHVAGSDLTRPLLQHARDRLHAAGRPAPFVQARAENLPYPTAVADTLLCMDVIEHVEHDAVALNEFQRVLRPNGLLILTVPAYQSLWSSHDTTAGHWRRYGRAQLISAVANAGFDIIRCTHFFSFLVPPAYAIRRTPLGRLAGSTDEEVSSSSRPVSAALRRLCQLERSLIGRGRDLPAGLSILLTARARPPIS